MKKTRSVKRPARGKDKFIEELIDKLKNGPPNTKYLQEDDQQNRKLAQKIIDLATSGVSGAPDVAKELLRYILTALDIEARNYWKEVEISDNEVRVNGLVLAINLYPDIPAKYGIDIQSRRPGAAERIGDY